MANYIINNITMSEIIHLVAQKANETAEKIVRENLAAIEYKNIISEKEKMKENKTSFVTKIKDWFRGKPEEEPKPPKSTPKRPVLPKKQPKRKSKRKGLSTRKG